MSSSRLVVSSAALLSSTLVFAACGSDPAPTPMPTPSTLDAAAVERSSAALVASVLVFDVAETLGGLGTLIGASPADNVAANINGRALGLVGTCGSVVRDGLTITVNVVAAGCVIPPEDPPLDPPAVFDPPAGMTAGSVTYTVSRAGDDLTISTVFADVVARGVPLSGTFTLTTRDATTWAVDVDVDATLTAATSLSGTLEVRFSGRARTIDGTLSVMRGADSTDVTFADIAWTRPICYPDAGSLTFGTEVLTVGTFDADTAASGAFTVTRDMTDSDATLPAYGSCPAS